MRHRKGWLGVARRSNLAKLARLEKKGYRFSDEYKEKVANAKGKMKTSGMRAEAEIIFNEKQNELYVRSYVMKDKNMPVAKLHKMSTSLVKAKAQSDIVHSIMDKLTEEEITIFKRGRNAHSYTSAKNADIVDYRHATGFEALIGYTYLKKDSQRLSQLLEMSIEAYHIINNS